jgi:hypothetical protein
MDGLKPGDTPVTESLHPARFQRDQAAEARLLTTMQEALAALEALHPTLPQLTRAYRHIAAILGGLRGELEDRQPFSCAYDIKDDAYRARWRLGETQEEIVGLGETEGHALRALIHHLGERLHG